MEEEILVLEEVENDKDIKVIADDAIKTETFCTNWSCVKRPVKLVNLKGEQVRTTIINSEKKE